LNVRDRKSFVGGIGSVGEEAALAQAAACIICNLCGFGGPRPTLTVAYAPLFTSSGVGKPYVIGALDLLNLGERAVRQALPMTAASPSTLGGLDVFDTLEAVVSCK
jgi:hypothetical protein